MDINIRKLYHEVCCRFQARESDFVRAYNDVATYLCEKYGRGTTALGDGEIRIRSADDPSALSERYVLPVLAGIGYRLTGSKEERERFLSIADDVHIRILSEGNRKKRIRGCSF